MKKILITGNLGYIGPVLISNLLKNQDYIIHGLDIGWFEHCCIEDIIPNKPSLQIYKDIRDINEDDIKDVYGVVHLCAVSNDPMGKEFETATYSINLDASIKLAQMCADNGVKKFVFASSCSVYGAGGLNAKNEYDKVNPLTAYAKSKISFEKELENINFNKEMTVTALRFSTACGPSPRIRLDLVLNDFVASAIVNERIDILSDGSPLRPLIDVEDMSKAILWSLNREHSDEDSTLIINVGKNSNNLTVLEMAYLVKDALPNISINVNEKAEVDKRSYAVDFNKFKELSDEYYPTYSIHDSIVRLIDQLNPLKDKLYDFRSSKYIRHNILRELKSKKFLNNQLSIR